MIAARLSDYALIGNARAAALVSVKGAIDWCCLPEFDSPAVFAALLDPEKGGNFSICPSGSFSSTQSYIQETNVVETIFRTAHGSIRLLDAFTAMSEEQKLQSLFPDHEIIRVIEGLEGAVCVNMEFAPRIFYGRHLPVLKDRKELGVNFTWKENSMTLLTSLDPDKIIINAEKNKATATFQVEPGEQVIFSLSYSSQSPAILPEVKKTGLERLQKTIQYWKSWSGRCKYTGIYSEQVNRSALTLKLLTHAPSGAIIAAPTTSLPEEPGGSRNWDYRYCWLRDASFTVRVLVKLGYEEEAHAYMNWILHATQLSRPKLQVVYSVFGYSSIKEKTLGWLSGYRYSRPVRIGNGADDQFQLDVYGEVLDAIYTYAPLGGRPDHDSRKFALQLGTSICKLWNRPDNGIWEIRSSLVHHTHSKVMAWVGLDRLVKLCRRYGWKAPVETFERTAQDIRNNIEQFGYNKQLNSYTRELNGTSLDASLLTLPLVEYCPATSPEMISTTNLILERLTKNRLVFRYREVDDGITGEEGIFGVCSFWLAETLAKAGRISEAKEVFETMLQAASPAGLFSEEVDPDTGELTGNYPQGFTHIGLINAALSINEELQKTSAAT